MLTIEVNGRHYVLALMNGKMLIPRPILKSDHKLKRNSNREQFPHSITGSNNPVTGSHVLNSVPQEKPLVNN